VEKILGKPKPVPPKETPKPESEMQTENIPEEGTPNTPNESGKMEEETPQ
jgi:hypothetical protein